MRVGVDQGNGDDRSIIKMVRRTVRQDWVMCKTHGIPSSWVLLYVPNGKNIEPEALIFIDTVLAWFFIFTCMVVEWSSMNF